MWIHQRGGKRWAFSWQLGPALIAAAVVLLALWQFLPQLLNLALGLAVFCLPFMLFAWIYDARKRSQHRRDHPAGQEDPSCMWCRRDYTALLDRQAKEQAAVQRAQYEAWRAEETRRAIADHQRLRQQYGDPR